jgi:hypothetical protein
MGASAGGSPRPRARCLPGWVGLLVGEEASCVERDGDGAAVEGEPVGRGAPTARGVGSDGCGAQARMRVEVEVGARLGPRLNGGAEAERVDGPGTGSGAGVGADTGVKGSRSLKRADDSRMGNLSAG